MTLQRGVQSKVCQRHDVGIQPRDVIEALVFSFFQRRDVCDVTERVKFKNFGKLSKYEKTPRMTFQPRRTPRMSFSY